jgi:Fe2+ transport system protein FeoA
MSATQRTLADLPVGGRGLVAAVNGTSGITQRLLEMGLTQGTEVEVVRYAPLGDPLEIRLWGYLLSLRKADARCVVLQPERAPEAK